MLHLCLVELASNALGDDLPVSPGATALDGSLGERVAGVELAGSPAGPAEVNVRVLVEGVELLAKHGQAAGVVGTAGLGEDGEALVGAEPVAEGGEGCDVVGGAGGGGAGAIGVEVLVDVEDEVVGAAVEVGDLVKSGGGAVVDEGAGVGPLVAGEEELVLGGAGLADGGDGGLDGRGPGVDGDIVLKESRSVRRREYRDAEAWSSHGDTYRLVHEAKGDLVVALVLGSNLRPKAGELSVSGTALANDLAVPAGVVVDVDNAESSAGGQAVLDLGVVDSPVGGAKGAADRLVDEELPADGDTEGVEAVVRDEVVHLVEAILAGSLAGARAASAISAAAEVETGDLCDVLAINRF